MKIKFKYSGISSTPGGIKINDIEYCDGKIGVNYLWVVEKSNYVFDASKFSNYSIFADERDYDIPIVLNYTSSYYGIRPYEGVYGKATYSAKQIYRREYQKLERYNCETNSVEEKTIIGDWKLVAPKIEQECRDFNITSGRSYQYMSAPEDATLPWDYANVIEVGGKKIGKPIKTKFNCWSLIELIPQENQLDAPILKKTYKADINNIWFFKYSPNVGSQQQNINKSEYNTLGQFKKFGYGKQNNISGSISCLLGSEVVPYSHVRYIERPFGSINNPEKYSTNEKVDMLNEWRAIAFSKNPKLLRDQKGQAWIVQISSSNNTPFNSYKNQPDTISFSWAQIDDVENCVIIGDGDFVPSRIMNDGEWHEVDFDE